MASYTTYGGNATASSISCTFQPQDKSNMPQQTIDLQCTPKKAADCLV
jgi:hypothetical protein